MSLMGSMILVLPRMARATGTLSICGFSFRRMAAFEWRDILCDPRACRKDGGFLTRERCTRFLRLPSLVGRRLRCSRRQTTTRRWSGSFASTKAYHAPVSTNTIGSIVPSNACSRLRTTHLLRASSLPRRPVPSVEIRVMVAANGFPGAPADADDGLQSIPGRRPRLFVEVFGKEAANQGGPADSGSARLIRQTAVLGTFE